MLRRARPSRPARDPLPREVGVLTAVSFSVAIGFGVVAPALPVFARQFGVDRTAAGAVVSAFALMRFVSALGGGRLVDRFGERRVLATGLAIVGVSSFLAGLSQTYAQLLVLRGIGGTGSAMFTVSAMSLLLRVTRADQRGRATGLYQSGFLVGGVTGPAVGGALIDFSARAPFFVYAGTLAVAGAVAAVFLSRARLGPKTEADAAKPASDELLGAPQVARMKLGQAFRLRPYRAALAVNFGTSWAVFGVRSSLVPLFAYEQLQLSGVKVGLGYFLSSLAQAATLFPAGRLIDQVGRRPGMVAGTLLGAAAIGSLGLAGSFPAYLVVMAVLGAASGFLGTAPGAIVGDIVRGRGGSVVAVFQMSGDLGTMTGPLIAGRLADTLSYGVAFGISGAVLAAGAALAFLAPETRYPGPAPVGA